MRISADPNDKGHVPNPGDYDVMLDGKYVPWGTCITADDELGMIVCVILDEHGHVIEDWQHRPGTAMTIVRTGTVRIFFRGRQTEDALCRVWQ